MKKLLTRILITLSVLLLGGQGNAFAKTANAQDENMPVKFQELQEHISVINLLESANFKSSFSPYQKQGDKIDPTDNEEEEESQNFSSKKLSVKKYTDLAANYFADVFSIPTPENHYTSIKKRIDNHSRFSYSISNRWYILFRVIRI
jgi:hypothetical protein